MGLFINKINYDCIEYNHINDKKPIDEQLCIVNNGFDMYILAIWDADKNMFFDSNRNKLQYSFEYWIPIIVNKNAKI